MKTDFRILHTITEYTRFYGMPAPAHPLLTLLDLSTLRDVPVTPEAVALVQTPVVRQFYTVSLKRNAGGAALRYGQQSYDYSEGVLSFMAPGQGCWAEGEVDVAGLRAMTGWTLVFHPDLLRPYPLAKKILGYGYFSYQVHEALHLSAREERLLEGLLTTIADELERPIDAFSQEVIVTQLDMLLTYANRFYHRQFLTRRTAEHDLLSRFETLLTAYFALEGEDRPLPTVQYFADALHLSPSYLSDMLRTLTGQTTQQHIHQALLEQAKVLLRTTSLSVKETAFRLGFDYPPYFSRLFKNKTGQTPAEFRFSAQ